MVVLPCQFVEHCVSGVHRVGQPACAVPAMASNRFNCCPANGIDKVFRSVDLTGRLACGAHRHFYCVAYLPRAERASLQTFDDALPDAEPNPMHRYARANQR